MRDCPEIQSRWRSRNKNSAGMTPVAATLTCSVSQSLLRQVMTSTQACPSQLMTLRQVIMEWNSDQNCTQNSARGVSFDGPVAKNLTASFTMHLTNISVICIQTDDSTIVLGTNTANLRPVVPKQVFQPSLQQQRRPRDHGATKSNTTPASGEPLRVPALRQKITAFAPQKTKTPGTTRQHPQPLNIRGNFFLADSKSFFMCTSIQQYILHCSIL